MSHHQHQPALDKQARLLLLGGLFAAGLAVPAPAPAETLTVTRGGSGSGVVTSSPPGIDCGFDCTEFYNLNTAVNLTAIAAPGSEFSGWSGSCSGTVNSCTVLMNADKNVIATFIEVPAPADPLSVAITRSCTGRQGEPIPLTGQAQGGIPPYAFTWSAPAGTVTNPTTAADKTLADVTFNQTGSFTVALSAADSSSPQQSANNTIDCAINVASLQVANFAKVPNGKDTYNPGDSIIFTVSAAGGVAPYIYNWEFSRDGLSWTSFGQTTSPTSPAYTFGEGGAYYFRATISDSTKPIPQTQSSSSLTFEVKTQPQDGTLERVQAPDSAGPNQTVTLSVKFSEGPQPQPNTPVNWAVTTTDGQPLPSTVTGRLRANQTITGADGIASNQFESGGQQFNYRITATVNTQSGPKIASFTLAVGLAPIVQDPTTPEGAMALYMDRACANLYQNGAPNAAAQQLLFRCSQLMQITNPNDAKFVMNQLTPRNNTEAANLGQNFGTRQLGNVLWRLAELRHGRTGVSLSGLSINQNGQALPAGTLSKTFTRQKGGGAGDEPGVDLGGRLGVFVNGSMSRGDKSRTTQESNFDYDAYDITGGVDYRFTDRFIAGFALGYSSTSSDLGGSGGNLDGSGYTLAGYANYFFSDNVFLDGVLLYGRGSFDMQRNIDYFIPGVTRERFIASASPDAQQWGASLGGGYDLKFDQGIQATLSGHLNYLKATLDGYDESGADVFSLRVQDNTLKSLTFSLGGEISRTLSMSWGVLTPRLRADWLHEFEGNSVPISGWLLADPIGGSNAFTYQSDKQDPNYFLVGAGASAVFSNGVQSFLFYQATLGKQDYTDHSVTVGIRFEF
ncbi:MAG: autotransporter outer membrane beta-barrel domain-containing protein [Candidatus Competibacteraceae bacterium]|nr:autotransporter outer membrane beta-barrel domain-containing protein [Candidatus Competibacteraceae bacterium]